MSTIIIPYNHEIATKSANTLPQQSIAATTFIRLGCTNQDQNFLQGLL